MSTDKKFEEITDKFENLNVDQNDLDVTDSKYVVLCETSGKNLNHGIILFVIKVMKKHLNIYKNN